MNLDTHEGKQVATLGGGCFWCTEAVFDDLRGVESVVSGYSGGSVPDPSYQQVCSGRTGHAEVIRVTFDPQTISYKELLEIFFTVHDPTTLNRQGADTGTQYRSVIFYHSDEQKRVAEEVIKEVNATGMWNAPVVTQLAAEAEFYPAEEYHQKYFLRNPGQGYCSMVVAPKVNKFRHKYFEKLKGSSASA